ncbi:MAG: FGGY family carbohydrate kinase [Clostridium luticellarii]|jgi:glycerol kinase|uniref:Glycerol kinase n=1 Tax=Clostridium luticellarii TaxID=1691940 RepID=A0A2T0BSC2_9CLOT|nr:FGGY-family carbohydrate kinase [Clostridium luticellarii]MCI1996391.1 FGGY family carbohydrate kinase [Clostridium luticellarii]MCI2040720.1 FGGY family carbohydrate kinase [Clostridium luticellarii]PRR86798.1 Glycerol kinase [Clostridium luticellarii]
MECTIIIDVGTSSLKSIIYSLNGTLIHEQSQEYHTVITGGDNVEQAPETWHGALLSTLRDTAEYVKEKDLSINAITVTSQRASVIPVDIEGQPLYNAIMWQDKRSTSQCSKLSDAIGINSLYHKTGLRLDPYFSAPKMLWLKEEQPNIYKSSYRLLGVQDFVIHLLTGKFITDWTQASRTMLMNINSFSWDEELLHQMGIDEKLLPELCAPGSIVGNLTEKMSQITGLKSGTPIIIGGGDQQCAALALNVLRSGSAEANTGTGSFVVAFSEKPAFDEEMRTLCSAAAVPGKWIAEAGIFNTGAIYRWVKEEFYKESSENSFEELNKEALKSTVGANGVLLLPHFQGSAAPYWNPMAKGVIFNLTLGTRRGDIVKAVLEGIALEIADNIRLIENISGKIDRVSVAGGMTKFDLFDKIQASAFNKNVIKYENSEASSLGALISSAVTLGIYGDYSEAFKNICNGQEKIFEPDRDCAMYYEKLLEKKNGLYSALEKGGVYKLFS